MRYITYIKNNIPNTVVWTKSQYRDNKNRECSHRDYMRHQQIPFEDAISIGMVYYNTQSGQSVVSFLPWESPIHKDSAEPVETAASSFCQNHPELKGEIQTDWNEYQSWLKRQQEFQQNK